MANRIRIGDLLVRAGVISTTQLSAALAEQKRWGGRIGTILVKMQFISEPLLVRALSKQLGLQIASLKNLDVPREVKKQLDPEQLRTAHVCPVYVDEKARTLNLAMVDPSDLRTLDEVRFRTGLRIVAQLAGEEEIERAIDRLYGKSAYPELELSSDMSATIPDGVGLTGALSTGPIGTGPLDTGPGGTGTLESPSPADTGSLSAVVAGELQLRDHQQRHERALRVMVDLLIEKGVFSREEYLALLAQQG